MTLGALAQLDALPWIRVKSPLPGVCVMVIKHHTATAARPLPWCATCALSLVLSDNALDLGVKQAQPGANSALAGHSSGVSVLISWSNSIGSWPGKDNQD